MKKADVGARHQNLELQKAAAQAWLAHPNNSKPAKEFDAQRTVRAALHRPSRFKVEAAGATNSAPVSSYWDFKRSLCDSYEIVAIAKKLERCSLDLHEPLPSPWTTTVGRPRRLNNSVARVEEE
ncbi:hypothetical protein HPP92_004170 [Vanilla planifolia]|uniref:Uncharacterized protein n=1 Tax=Vanilla planifolia TaxID=51239 RepID=A0A835VP73_VANPL|nr:hypothetical protein HPP92_004170 [Vanilla planifolia]